MVRVMWFHRLACFLTKWIGSQPVERSALPAQSPWCPFVLWSSRASKSQTWTLRKKSRLRTSAQMPRLPQSQAQEWTSCWREPGVSSPRYPSCLVLSDRLLIPCTSGVALEVHQQVACGSLFKSAVKKQSLLNKNPVEDVSLRLGFRMVDVLFTEKHLKDAFCLVTSRLCTLVVCVQMKQIKSHLWNDVEAYACAKFDTSLFFS